MQYLPVSQVIHIQIYLALCMPTSTSIFISYSPYLSTSSKSLEALVTAHLHGFWGSVPRTARRWIQWSPLKREFTDSVTSTELVIAKTHSQKLSKLSGRKKHFRHLSTISTQPRATLVRNLLDLAPRRPNRYLRSCVTRSHEPRVVLAESPPSCDRLRS